MTHPRMAHPQMGRQIVEFRNVSFRYNGSEVLSGIHFTVPTASYTGLIGPNGGGKTTTLKLALGLLQPTEGEVRVFGKPASRLSRLERSRIGYVRQRAGEMDGGFPGTIDEVAQTALYARVGIGRWLTKAHRRRVARALEEVGLWRIRKSLVRELSGGQQQRLYLARALACDPQLLLLDEPTSAVDAKAQEQFYKLVRQLHRDHGMAIVLVSHDLITVSDQVDQLVCVNRTLQYQGPVAQGRHLLQAGSTLMGAHHQRG